MGRARDGHASGVPLVWSTEARLVANVHSVLPSSTLYAARMESRMETSANCGWRLANTRGKSKSYTKERAVSENCEINSRRLS